jgi:hypothetical protein
MQGRGNRGSAPKIEGESAGSCHQQGSNWTTLSTLPHPIRANNSKQQKPQRTGDPLQLSTSKERCALPGFFPRVSPIIINGRSG